MIHDGTFDDAVGAGPPFVGYRGTYLRTGVFQEAELVEVETLRLDVNDGKGKRPDDRSELQYILIMFSVVRFGDFRSGKGLPARKVSSIRRATRTNNS